MTKRASLPVLPNGPVDLVAFAIGGDQVILAWTECGTGGLGFHIERADGTGSDCLFSDIGITGINIGVFCDVSAKPRTSYSYRVHAWNALGVSPSSNVVEVTTSPSDME